MESRSAAPALIHDLGNNKVDDPGYSLYTHFRGSPETKFEVIPEDQARDFVPRTIDKFEIDYPADKRLCSTGHFAGEKYWIGAYKRCTSPRYVFMKFGKTP